MISFMISFSFVNEKYINREDLITRKVAYFAECN